MKQKTIYLVMAITDHESADATKAFQTEAAARAFAQKCAQHQQRAPEAPGVIEDTPANDALHESYWAKHEKWRSRHPAGRDNAHFDRFTVRRVRLMLNADLGPL